MTAVHVVLPDSVGDPARPSGGNAYDRRVCDGLAATGWSVRQHPVPGRWPRPDAAARAALAAAVAGLPDGAVALVDGLIGSVAPEVLVPASRRLRTVVLVHTPLGELGAGAGLPGVARPGGPLLDDPAPPPAPRGGPAAVRPPRDRVAALRAAERAVLSAAAAVVTTSGWTRRRLLDRYALPPGRVHVAEPGVEAAPLVPGTATGRNLLCVAALTPLKGQDDLVAALAALTDLPWDCVCVGSPDRDPGFVGRLRRQIRDAGVGDRAHLVGTRTGAGLDAAYAAADLLVLASHAETYGMVVTEALARGLPVIATAVGGLPETLGHGTDGTRPGLLVPPGDPAALGAALRDWLGDAGLRWRLRRAARERRATLAGWPATTDRISHVLAGVAAGGPGRPATTDRLPPLVAGVAEVATGGPGRPDTERGAAA